MLVFPTSQGKYYEWEDRGMIASLKDPLEQGLLQLYCVDSIDAESWYCGWAHPSGRAYRHDQYNMYLMGEVLPLSLRKNDNPYLIVTGASFGAYHAMNFGLRYPSYVSRILAMSGLYDIRRFVGTYTDDHVYYNNPIEFIAHEHEASRLERLRQQDIIIATGRDDSLHNSAQSMSAALWNKGIGNALRVWDGWAHDWIYWQKMLQLYISGHD